MARLFCVLLLAGITRAGEVDDVRALAGDASVRTAAAERLMALGPSQPSVIDKLLPLFEHADAGVRASAIRVVGAIVDSHGHGIVNRARRRARRDKAVTKESERAVENALAWLAAHQETAGHWDCDAHGGMRQYDVGVTALAVLAFLGAAKTDHEAAKRGLRFLIESQAKDGRIGKRYYARFPTSNAVAALALAEAWALTRDPAYRSPAQRSARFLGALSSKPHVGWGYRARSKERNTHVTGWMVCALRVADLAGLVIDFDAARGGWIWIDKLTNPENGRTGYWMPGSRAATYGTRLVRHSGAFGVTTEEPDRGTHEFLVIDRIKFPVELTESTTAQAVMCRMLVIPKGDDLAHKGFALCLKRLPTWTLKGTIDVAYWSYASVAAGLLRKARPPEKAAQAWFEALHKAVLPPQKSDGSWPGPGRTVANSDEG